MMEAYKYFGKNTYLMDSEVENIFNMVDHNRNGFIDYSEFISCCTNIISLVGD